MSCHCERSPSVKIAATPTVRAPARSITKRMPCSVEPVLITSSPSSKRQPEISLQSYKPAMTVVVNYDD